MRLLNLYLCWNSLVSHVTPKSFSSTTFHISLTLILYCLFLIPVDAAPSDIIESHLLPTHGYTDGGAISGSAQASLRRDQVGLPNTGESERSNRAHKEIFRLELLRQIKAIDHMKCFPKVLCGLSVDSDKSFGINKSNFVKSYLELMRNIKPAQEGVEERLRTEDEVEGELLWPFSPHNPDRKHHSSFERIGSGAMSASVELGDSPEYVSRGLSSRMGDSSISVEKVDRMGLAASAEESKEKFTGNKPSSHASITRMENSKIPGEKKKKDNSDKSLTAKLTSYFTSWLPEISFVKDTEDESSEAGRDNMKRVARSMSDEENVRINSNWPLSRNYFLAQLSKMLESFKMQRVSSRQGRADEAFSTAAADHVLARDGIHGESAEHEGDIYHTAVNIGKRLKDPKQCDYIYNGCPLEYNKIMDMISSIRTDINPHDEAAEAVSHELGLEPTPTTTSTTTTTTTTTSTTTTRKPQRKKTRPSTKIMHVLPNGEKVEINFRLGGSEDSEESSSSQRDYAKKETTDDDYSSSEKDNKGDGEVVVVDLGQRSTLSTDEVMSSEKRIISNRKGAPIDTAVVRNKSNKRKTGYSNSKKNIVSELSRPESLERSEELDIEQEDEVEVAKPSTKMASLLSAASFHNNNNKQKSALKLSGLTLTTNNNDEQPLEISPSYVIIKHQPLSVHTTSLLPPDNLPSPQQQIKSSDRLQSFQLIQNGQLIDADQLTDHLKNYIRQNGGIIPKLSLHSSGLITTDSSDNSANTPNPYSLRQQLPETQALISSASLKTQQSKPLTTLSLLNARPQPTSKPNLSHLSISNQFKSALPQSPYSSYLSYIHNNGPAMVGSVPGRLDSLQKATTPSTTTTTPSTSTESIILPGMQETLMLDTDEITDDTMDKLSAPGTVPTWITPSPTASSVEIRANKESEEEQTMLENLNKTYLNESGTRNRYKNPKKKKTVVKSNSSRVRNPPTSNKRNKGTKKGSSKYSSSSGSEESAEGERVVIKHAGPYSGSPTIFESPLKGPGPHGGAYPYLPVGSMKPNVFPGYPFWRL